MDSRTPRTDAHYGRLPNARQTRGLIQDYKHAADLELALATANERLREAEKDALRLGAVLTAAMRAYHVNFSKLDENQGYRVRALENLWKACARNTKRKDEPKVRLGSKERK